MTRHLEGGLCFDGIIFGEACGDKQFMASPMLVALQNSETEKLSVSPYAVALEELR